MKKFDVFEAIRSLDSTADLGIGSLKLPEPSGRSYLRLLVLQLPGLSNFTANGCQLLPEGHNG